MLSTNVIVQKPPPATLFCSFSLYKSTVILAGLQTLLTFVLALLYHIKIEGASVIVKVLIWIHICCAATALIFMVFCMLKRKIGSTYEIVLHAYLLTVLLNGLASFFGVMYIPLFFLQTTHSLMEGVDYFICFAFCATVLGLQWAVKQVTEQMLPVMEHDFKV